MCICPYSNIICTANEVEIRCTIDKVILSVVEIKCITDEEITMPI
jgi:hypothetical protein